MATFGGKDRSDSPGGQGSDTAGGKAGAGPADSHDSGGSYSVGADRNSQAGAQAVAAAAMRARLNATPTVVPGGASGGYNSLAGLTARDPVTAAAVQARNNYDQANQGLGAGLLDRIAGIAPMDPTSRLQNSLKTGVVPDTGVNYGIDAIGAGAGIAGAATGLPLGSTYSALRDIAQRTGLVGQNFGRVDLGSGGANPGVAAGGHPLGGGNQGGNTGNRTGVGSGIYTGGNINTGGGGGGNKPPVPPPPKPPVPPPPTWQDEVAGITPKLRSDFDWNMQQRGLNANTKDISGNAIDWDQVFNQELAHRQSGMPTGAEGTKQSDFDTAANQYLLPNFGASALDDYQTRLRSLARDNVGGQGHEAEIANRFSSSAIQPYLDKIYGDQYNQAKTLVDNTKARGEFNDLGYNAALNLLNTQGTAGKSTLSDLGNSYLTTDKGTLNDALSGIYDKIGNYTVGSGYNPSSDLSDLSKQEGSLSGQLEGQITGAAPSIFDTSTLFQKASAQQGATSGGSLSDTLAQRNMNAPQRNRGLSNTGAF